MINLHNAIYSDVVYNRTERTTKDDEILLPAGPVYYADYCKQLTPINDESNWKKNTIDSNVSQNDKNLSNYFALGEPQRLIISFVFTVRHFIETDRLSVQQ